MTDLRDHPDYGAGYFDRIGQAAPSAAYTSEYRAGWNAADEACAILKGGGFREARPGQYTKRTLP